MRLVDKGPNIRLLKLDNGVEVLFSYEIPVAGFIPETGYFRSSKQHSNTTERHIQSYVGKKALTVKEQGYIEKMLSHC